MADQDNFRVTDTDPRDGPNSQLEIYDKVVESNVDDEFLSRENFGLGNYRDSEMWQQIQSFEMGMYAHSAFSRLIRERAIYETKRALGEHGWTMRSPTTGKTVRYEGYEAVDESEDSRHKSVTRRGEEIWEALVQERTDDRYPAREALQEIAGLDGDWTPPHHRMMMMRHEASRSRGARLMDNFFQRVKRRIQDGNGNGNGGNGRLSRRNGQS